MDVEPVNLSGNAAAGSSAVSAIRSGPPTLPGGIILDVSDPPAAVDPLPPAGEPFVPLRAAERRGRSRSDPTAPGGLVGAPEGRFPEDRARETPCVSRTIRAVSSNEDQWILGDRKSGSWGSCKDPLWERLLERFGVMREPAARGRGRDRSCSRRSEPRTRRRSPRDRRAGFRVRGAGSRVAGAPRPSAGAPCRCAGRGRRRRTSPTSCRRRSAA